MKTCIDCKHSRTTYGMFCTRPHKKKISVVTGEELNNDKACHQVRSSFINWICVECMITDLNYRCGPSGRWFERKEELSCN
jgi:hypothetical protein